MLASRLLLALLLCAPAAFADDSDALPASLPADGCVSAGQLRLAQAADAYRKRFTHSAEGRHITKEVHGLTLTDGERAIHYLERSLGKRPPASWQAAVDARCARVLCALQKTLGDQESALWLLVAAAEVDAPPSLDQTGYEVESVWEQHELRALARALLEAPPELKKITSLKAWRRLPGGQNLRKGAWYNAVSYPKDKDYFGLGTIVIRDTVWKFAQRDQRAVVVHELGHHWEQSRKLEGMHPVPSLSEEWLSLSGWVSKNGGTGEHDYALSPGVQIATAGETIPTEDFADSVANYRYAPRLLRAYSKSKYQLLHKLFGKEHRRPDPDPALEKAWATIGGPLKSLRDCATQLQRASFGGKLHQAELYTVMKSAKGGTHWEPIPRNQFVVHAKCVDRAIEALHASHHWAEIECRQDPEEVAVAVADRLEDAWAAWAEAAEQIRAAVPPSHAEACLQKRDLTEKCFAGAEGLAAAGREASRLLGEFENGDQTDQAALAHQLIVQTPLAPSDEELRERFPVLRSSTDLFYACLKGAEEISAKKAHWLFWVHNPKNNERRGFGDAVWTPVCQRDFAAHLGEAGLKVDEHEKLFEHVTYLLKNQAQTLIDQFATKVLQPAEGECPEAACSARWLKPRLAGMAPQGLVDDLARHLAGTLHPH